jgi:hypothetical protein
MGVPGCSTKWQSGCRMAATALNLANDLKSYCEPGRHFGNNHALEWVFRYNQSPAGHDNMAA